MDLASAISNHLRETEMDFKFELDTKTSKKSATKKGRRSGLPFGFSLTQRDEATPETIESSDKRLSSPPKTRRSGGWAGDTLKSAIRRSSSALFEQEQLDNRMSMDDDIPVIPNLDDYEDVKIAKAPLVGQKVASYKELEMDLLKHSAFSSLEDVNLRVLTAFMQNAQALEEPDVPWTKDSLFADLISYNHSAEDLIEKK